MQRLLPSYPNRRYRPCPVYELVVPLRSELVGFFFLLLFVLSLSYRWELLAPAMTTPTTMTYGAIEVDTSSKFYDADTRWPLYSLALE